MATTGKLARGALARFSLGRGPAAAPVPTFTRLSQFAVEVGIVFDQPALLSQYAVEVLAPVGGDRFWVALV